MDTAPSRIPCLDGLRGIAALWVLLGHSLMLSGWHVPIAAEPDLGVDLFIILSGFLMVHQYGPRLGGDPRQARGAWFQFWARRFFRVAPLYYVLLAIALWAGPILFAQRMQIDLFLGRNPQLPDRYLDGSLANVMAHVSFLFGLHPGTSFRTPLPDWSLGLEMQFYAAFPLMMLATRKFGWPWGATMLAALGAGAAVAMQYAAIRFPMPSALPLKLHIFLCGMLVAAALRVEPRRAFAYLALALTFVLLPFGGEQGWAKVAVRLLLVGGFFVLVHGQIVSGRASVALKALARMLGNRLFHWLGELSYGVYLIHLLLLQPIAAFVIVRFGDEVTAPGRFGLVVLMLVPLAYAVAWLAYQAVEVPGRMFGRLLLERFGAKPSVHPAGLLESPRKLLGQ